MRALPRGLTTVLVAFAVMVGGGAQSWAQPTGSESWALPSGSAGGPPSGEPGGGVPVGGADGQSELARVAAQLLAPPANRSVSVAYVDSTGVQSAHLGAHDAGEYEIGSMTKTFTGALLAVAVDRGEVRPDSRLGDFLPVQGTQVADATLEELAGHRSGLLEFAVTPEMLAGGVMWKLFGDNPFTFDREQLIQQARVAPLTGRGTFRYSTLGMALLGQALASAAGTDYASLVRDRITDPLGLGSTWIPATAADLPATASVGVDEWGRPQDPWAIGAYAPGGGARSTITDMTTYAQALLRDQAPGMAALQPRWQDGPTLRRGYAWAVFSRDGVDYTMHSGGTGGFSGMIVLDRAHGVAVVVLQDAAGAKERPVIDLLREMRDR
ncbi:CubicO group peptidase, beta-lactamase class C family [Rhodococcus tukisamuensis]|uniref:CubicO group peptidase, beta-lactamase class C family n=2 Tax=Rhodococcus tukisamuensis TaxID=168276 RepID=A0A1G7DMV1_9NOCA|nr:CubicO group peptidase, beta-lactamase class C family [Rhodococcus tukisamuensis]